MRKYLLNGLEVVVMQTLPNGFLVSDVYSYDDEEDEVDTSEKQYFVEKVFDKAPTKKYDDRIIKLNKEIQELEDKRGDLHKQVNSTLHQIKQNEKLLVPHSELTHLWDFLNGKITHCIKYSEWSAPEIMTFQQTFVEEDKDVRLLCLYGNSRNGEVRWKVNSYRDGSGSWTQIDLCLSMEQAKMRAQEILDSFCKEAVRSKNNYRLESAVKSADKYNLQIDPVHRVQVAEFKGKEKEDKRQKLLKELEALDS